MMNSGRKKITFVVTQSELGGAQRYVVAQAKSLDRKNYGVSVICGGEGWLITELEKENINVIKIADFKREICLLSDFKSFLKLLTIFKEINPDIVHTNSTKAGLL
jgi:hypothetical protein